jgi:NAD(P)-dependent dehydrogenase (short-subunit alcohol dehydrogenase family)
VPLEVTDAASIQQAHELVAGHAAALDVLINNAGAMKGAFRTGADPRLGRLEAGDLDRLFAINATAPVMMTQTFLDLLRAGDRPRVVNISSWLGSIADKNMAGYYGYSASKAALNMLTRILAVELRALGVVAIVMHPGWARTAMGGPRATLEAPEAVAGMLRVIDRLTMNDTARFWDYTGHEMAW